MDASPSNRLSRAVSAACLVWLALGVAPASEAATIRVPADAATIQEAINAAVTGDTILVAPGTYLEVIDFGGKAISVRSEQGPDATIIDAGGNGSVVTFRSSETRSAVLSGFTLRNGFNTFSGGGVYISNAAPTISGNIITENRSCTGVGIYSYFSSPRIEGNTITRNTVYGCTGAWGIGIYVGGNTAAEVIDNVIFDNSGEAASGGGVALFAAGNAVLIGNVIARNSTSGAAGCGWGGGVAIANFVQATIVNNLVIGNSACSGGGFHWRGSNGNTVLANNTIADNEAASWPGVYATFVDGRNRLYNNIISAQSGPALFCENASSSTPPVLDSNDVFTAQGPAYGGTCADQTGISGNISADPLYIDAQGGDYRVPVSSPVVDMGNNAAPSIQPTDLAGSPRILGANSGVPDRIDIGAFEYVNDNEAPVADAGADLTAACGADCLAAVTLNGTGFDPDGDALTFTWAGPFGTVTGATPTVPLPAGSHVLTLTVSDGEGGSDSDSVLVVVRDVTPPSIDALTATPSILAPANHDLVAVVLGVTASDICGGPATCRIGSVTSNEPVTGLGGGDSGPDWQITGDLTLNLRAERSNKGTGRVYTIAVECTDASGNRAARTVTVSVPRK